MSETYTVVAVHFHEDDGSLAAPHIRSVEAMTPAHASYLVAGTLAMEMDIDPNLFHIAAVFLGRQADCYEPTAVTPERMKELDAELEAERRDKEGEPDYLQMLCDVVEWMDEILKPDEQPSWLPELKKAIGHS